MVDRRDVEQVLGQNTHHDFTSLHIVAFDIIDWAMIRHNITIAFLVTLGYGAEVNNTNLEPLQFKKNGTFQIAIFSDMHFGQC